MTKLKYENRGGRGFITFNSFTQTENNKSLKAEKPLSKSELLYKDIKKETRIKNGPWELKDLCYKNLKMGQAVRILSHLVHDNSETAVILKLLKKNYKFFKRVEGEVLQEYTSISSAALKITIERNKKFYEIKSLMN
mgnify:CR=1 FL=1|tara:strand:- start:155 stop:565 length:411 start_codon:yes stop_codon:yes gene_type:complete